MSRRFPPARRFTAPRGPTFRRRPPRREALAMVEFVLFLPVLMIFTLGTMDVCSVIFMKETVVLAAYEGARAGINRGATDADCRDRVTEFLTERGIRYDDNDVVQFPNGSFDTAETLQAVTVRVHIPAVGNTITRGWLAPIEEVAAQCTLRKEYENLN